MLKLISAVSVLCWAILLGPLPALGQHGPGHGHQAGGVLKHGRYVGYVRLDDRQEKVAVVADFFLESPEDFREFPRLNALFKFSLGGFGTHEYYTEIFQDIRYDFDNGVLTLDETGNDFLMTGEVHNLDDITMMMGQVFIRSAGVSGVFNLTHVSDSESYRGDLRNDPDEGRYIPLLDGQYEGRCDGQPVAFQITTARGLDENDGRRRIGFNKSLRIIGRFAVRDRDICGSDDGTSPWCTVVSYTSGTYNPYLGRLNFQGAGRADDCEIIGDRLSCAITTRDGSRSCSFTKSESSTQRPVFHSRRHNITPTSDQNQEVPPPNPPANRELSETLRGNFTGYLHNESNDTYQVIRLNVMPYSSTENPHNPNQMMVTTTGISYIGSSSQDFSSHRYEPRSYYLRPGFTLNGPDTDSFINVVTWRRGFISGIWYSHQFGRVGTVQLIKGERVPPISSRATKVGSFVGEYDGPHVQDREPVRWFKLLFPAESDNMENGLVHFTGSYQAIINDTPIQDITAGAFDPYTGALAWIISKNGIETIVSGQIGSHRKLELFWPPSPGVYGVITNDYRLGDFRKIGN